MADTLRDQHQALAYLGFRIFKWLLGLVLVLLLGLAVAGWVTYPDRGQFVPDPGRATAEQWSALAAAKTAWVTQLKDLSQAFLFAPVFPLLGAVIGYIFGREGVQSGPIPDAAKGGVERGATGAGNPTAAGAKSEDAAHPIGDPAAASGSTPDVFGDGVEPALGSTGETSETPGQLRGPSGR